MPRFKCNEKVTVNDAWHWLYQWVGHVERSEETDCSDIVLVMFAKTLMGRKVWDAVWIEDSKLSPLEVIKTGGER